MLISGEQLQRRGMLASAGPVSLKPNRARASAPWNLSVSLVALLLLRSYPVSLYPSFPVCGFRWLTGRPCPLCGMTHALSCLTRGNWFDAVHFNLLSPVVFGILLATIGSASLRFFAPEFSSPADFGFGRDKWRTICFALFAVYGILRIAYLVP
jgi:Protein of unknown function (DUF2752)